METLRQDLRYALRVLVKSRSFAGVAVLTLAIGIGANAAIFSVVNALLIRPLSYKSPERLVAATELFPKFGRATTLSPEYAAWANQNSVFTELAASGVSLGKNLSGVANPERVDAAHVTTNFFEVLGITPALGRTFLSEDGQAGKNHVVVLSYPLWASHFASDAQVVGKSVTLDGEPYAVIGVMPNGFVQPGAPECSLWLPDAMPPGAEKPGRHMSILQRVIGRLKPGVTLAQAQANLEVIARRMDREYPAPWSGYHAAAHPRVTRLQDELAGSAKPALAVLSGAVAFLLLIACANVANLFLVRAAAREKELAVRVTLGASRARLLRLLVTEGLVLAIAGGALGMVLAWWGSSALTTLMPSSMGAPISLDARVLAFTFLCSLIAGAAFAVVPALAASKLSLNAALKEGGAQGGETRHRARFRAALAAAQLALSLILLTGAGLMMRSFILLLRVNPGFDARNVLTASVWLAPLQIYDPPHQAAFFREALGRIRAIPGVESGAVTDEAPLATFNSLASGVAVENRAEELAGTVVPASISADFFRTMHVPILEGRAFSDGDADGTTPVAILNRSLAEMAFKNENPIGKRVRIGDGSPWLTVVGVVADTRHRSLDDQDWPVLYRPYGQSPAFTMTFVVRTGTDAARFAPAIRGAVQAVDPAQPLADVATLEQRLAETLSQRRERTALLAIFAGAALFIAVIGMYGVVAYSVAQRKHEIGVRLALGAQPENVLAMIVSQGMRIALLGLTAGSAGAFALTRVLSSFLFEVTATDPLTFACTAALLIAVALGACYIPARRAMRMDPMAALRYE